MSDADRKRFAAPVHGGDEITAVTRPDSGDRPPKRQRANASESVTGSETTRGGSSTILGSDHVEERTEAAGASIGLPSQGLCQSYWHVSKFLGTYILTTVCLCQNNPTYNQRLPLEQLCKAIQQLEG